MRLVLSILFFTLINGASIAQFTTIQGIAPKLKNKTIRFFRNADYITEKQELIATTSLKDDMTFSIQLNIKGTEYINIMAGSVKTPLYVTAGGTYRIEISDESGQELFFNSTNDSNDVMYAIGEFNYEYNRFSVEHYDKFITGTIRNEAKKFIAYADSKYVHVTQNYFQEHKKYKSAELAYSSRLYGRKSIAEKYFTDQPVLYHHPEYMYFFKSFYGGVMKQLFMASSPNPIKKIVELALPYDTLVNEVMKLDFLNHRERAELFALQGIQEIYNTGKPVRATLEKLLQQAKQSKNKEIQSIAENMIDQMNRLKAGSPVIEFQGKDTAGNIFSLNNYFDKPIYLIFFSPEDPGSIKEIPAINNVFERFKKDIHFISVCSGCNTSSLQSFINTYEINWNCWIIDSNVETEYEILKYPTAFIIKKQGYFFRSPAELPSQGLDEYLILVRRDAFK